MGSKFDTLAPPQVFAELLQTEENYVGILKTILEVFRDPLEVRNMNINSIIIASSVYYSNNGGRAR